MHVLACMGYVVDGQGFSKMVADPAPPPLLIIDYIRAVRIENRLNMHTCV